MFRSLCLLLFLAGPAVAQSDIDVALLASLPNVSFHGPNQLASGRLQPDDIALLKRAGVRQVIDLSVDTETPDFDEGVAVRAAGLEYENLPIHGAEGLSDANVRRFDALIAAAGASPTLIHCASSNRVGALMALRAASLQGESAEAAIKIGKSWGLKSLEPAVRDRLANSANSGATASEPGNATPSFPRIKSAGEVFALGDGVKMPARDVMHRVVIDATDGESSDAGINRELETAARAVNLYALAGVPDDKVRIAIVIHGKATPIVLSDASYQSHFSTANQNAGLIKELRAAGVEFFVCGQALRHRGYMPADVRTGVRVALSAMTQLVELQDAGYRLIP